MRTNFFPKTLQKSAVHCMALSCLLLLAACSDSNDANYAPTGLTGCADTESCFSKPGLQIGGDRLAQVQIP
jgi:hypothetical protein